MMSKGTLFVISLVGMAVSAAVLVWLIPTLFHSGEQRGAWVYGVLAGITAIFAVGVRYWRPSTSISDRK